VNRPFTYGNLAISLDGRISTADRALHGFGGREDRDLMEELRSQADAVMIGAATVRDENPRLRVSSQQWIEARRLAGRSSQPRAIVVSRSLDFPWHERELFRGAETRPLVITHADHPSDRLADLRTVADLLLVPATAQGVDLALAMERLSALGIHQLLLEGGGELNFAMLAAGLVDEFHLTLCPLVFGGRSAPGAFSGAGFPAGSEAHLELVSLRQGAHDRLFLRYRCRNATPR
jgi:riboflavin-specific deaminase-like protein